MVLIIGSVGTTRVNNFPPPPPPIPGNVFQIPVPPHISHWLIELYSMTVTLGSCHDTDGIASLAYNPGRQAVEDAHGFRHHARNNALARGITGYIQRYRHKDVMLVMEGTREQLEQFNAWLHQCYGQGMFASIFVHSRVPIPLRGYYSFSIYLDHTRPFHPQTHPEGIIRGSWSDNFYEKLSAYSANLYQGGHSRSSRDSDSRSSHGQDPDNLGSGSQTGRVLRSSLKAAGEKIIGVKRKKL
jgi:acylphosphatase